MDIFWIVLGSIFLIAGLIGCFLPLIPGPPLGYFGLLTLQLRTLPGFSTAFLIWWAIIVIVITLLDYIIPAYGTKKFGGSKYGIWGCTIGMILGLWAGPLGIIIGPFIGSMVGEMIGNKDSNQAFKAAIGSFIGFLVGTLIKFISCGVMIWYFIKAI